MKDWTTRACQASRGAASLLLMGAVVGLTGCGAGLGPTCSAVGWVNTITIEVKPASPAVSTVWLCLGDDCATPETPSNDEGPLLASFTAREGNTWQFSTAMTAPDAVTLVFLDDDGIVQDTRDVELEWEHATNTGPCGGPGTADVTVTL